MRRLSASTVVLTCAFVVTAAPSAAAGATEVTRVEPPAGRAFAAPPAGGAAPFGVRGGLRASDEAGFEADPDAAALGAIAIAVALVLRRVLESRRGP
jgi:hypothetical protein